MKTMTLYASKIVFILAIGFSLNLLPGLNDRVFAQTIYFDDSDPDYIKLGNDLFYEIGFRKTNGSIAYITDKSTGANITQGSRYEHLWGTLFPDAGWAFQGGGNFSSSGADLFSYHWNAVDENLDFNYIPGLSSAVKVTAHVDITPSNDSYFDLRIDLEHQFGVPMEYFSLPTDLVFLENEVEEALLPITPGVILEQSFFLESRTYSTNYPGWPGVFSDLMSMKLQNGSFGIYTIYDDPNFENILRIGISFADDNEYIANSTLLRRSHRTYLIDGQELASPVVRIHIGQPHKAVIERFRTDNHFDQYQSIVQKLGDDFQRVAQSPLLKADFEIRFSDYYPILDQLPSPAILHPPNVHVGGFDRNYPDVFPPDPAYGTVEELRALYERAQARGMFVMPYSNPTWWDDESPTIQNELPPLTIDDIAVIGKSGPYWETYGDNSGPVACPWHPFVIDRLNRLITSLTVEIPSDFIFEDQIGARGSLLDFNPSSPSPPLSYANGWLEHTRRHAHIGLGTEMGFDRLLETELFFCGSTQLFKLKIGSTSGWWGDDNWHNYPMTPFLANDKVFFYQHNLDEGTATLNLEMLSWNLSFGFMQYYLVQNWPGAITEWLDVAAQFQAHVGSRYAGQRMTDWLELQPEVTQSIFPSVTVTTNWDEASTFSMYSHTVPPLGAIVNSSDGSMTAGIFNVYNDTALTAGDHYVIVERFFDEDSIRVWQPKGDDTPIKIDLQSLSSTANVRCYGFAGDIIFEVPIAIDGQYGKFNWNRIHDELEVEKYMVTAGSIYLTSPQLTEPIDWATIMVPDPTFRWDAVDGATAYQIQISTNNTFAETVVDAADITQTEFSTDVLESGTTYFGRLRASNTSKTSNWSAIRRFRMDGINISDRLVAYYPLDGTAEDSIGISDGSITGDVAPASDRFGNPDHACDFDGDEDYVTFPQTNAFTSIDKQMTISCWIYPRSLAFETGVMIREQFWYFQIHSSGTVLTGINNEENFSGWLSSLDQVDLDTWSLIAFTFDAQTLKIYINGEPSGEMACPAVRIGPEGASSIPTLAKGFGLSQNCFDGFIDDVRVYDRALNDEEMIALLGVEAPALITPAHWATIPLDSTAFQWKAVDGAVTYHIQISPDASFEQTTIDQDDITQTQFTTESLKAGTTYFWRVRASNESQTSNWSSVHRFRIEGINIADRLVAYYPLDGNPEDSIGNNDGILMGNVILANDRFDNPDSAYSFDGDEDYISFSESEPYTSLDKQLTISAWVYPKSLARETGVMARDGYWYLLINENGTTLGYIFDENQEAGCAVNRQNIILLNTWSHVAYTYDGQTINMYVDGKHAGLTQFPSQRIGNPIESAVPTLGKGIGDYWNDFHGSIDEVRIYDRALSKEEMAELYRKTATENFSPQIVAFSPAQDTVITEGDSLEFLVEVQDEDNDTLFCTWFYDDTTIVIDTTTFKSSIIIPFPKGSAGTHRIKASVTDGKLSAEKTWNVTVEEYISAVQFVDNNIPTEYSLKQNYPNPFNPTTTIRYELPRSAMVVLKIYDILGREVLTLVNERQKPGRYAVTFDAKKLVSSVYFYKLQAGSDFVDVKKMLLLR